MRDDEMTDKETRMFRANVAKFNNVKSEATKSCSLFSRGHLVLGPYVFVLAELLNVKVDTIDRFITKQSRREMRFFAATFCGFNNAPVKHAMESVKKSVYLMRL